MELPINSMFWLITSLIAIGIALVIIIFFSFQGGSFRVIEPILGFFRPVVVSGG